MGVAPTWGTARNACSDVVSGSRHLAFFPIPSHPLARRTRDGALVCFLPARHFEQIGELVELGTVATFVRGPLLWFQTQLPEDAFTLFVELVGRDLVGLETCAQVGELLHQGILFGLADVLIVGS